MELISSGEGLDWLTHYSQWQYRETRKKHRKQIEAINEEIGNLLDVYFSRLHSLVFHDGDSPRYPSTK